MKLCLDFGNSQLFGGLVRGRKILFRFRKNMSKSISSDEMGIFLRDVIRENGYELSTVKKIIFCSVTPDVNHSVKNSCRNYFRIIPLALEPGVKTGLQIKYANPTEVGADRIAGALGASEAYPGQNIIIVDLGTATTIDVLTKNKEYLGGVITPGMSISMQSLEQHTAKLPKVEILKPKSICGKSTVQSIQAGLYFGNLGAIKEICKRLKTSCFPDEEALILGTGGFSRLFMEAGIFDQVNKDLVLEGLIKLEELNR